MIKIGQKVRINPFNNIRTPGLSDSKETFEGTVHFVHPTHRWFNVEYTDNAGKRLVGYKFDDIGREVKII